MTRPLSRPEAEAARIRRDNENLTAAFLRVFGPGPHWTQPTSARQLARRDHDETHAEMQAFLDRWDPDTNHHRQQAADNWTERETR